MIDPNGLLMVEPRGRGSSPVIDTLTRKMAAAWRKRTNSEYGYRGFHICDCGAGSDNHDHWINGLLTNSLCVHYVACHRANLSPEDLAKVEALGFGEEDPTPEELQQKVKTPLEARMDREQIVRYLARVGAADPVDIAVTHGEAGHEGVLADLATLVADGRVEPWSGPEGQTPAECQPHQVLYRLKR